MSTICLSRPILSPSPSNSDISYNMYMHHVTYVTHFSSVCLQDTDLQLLDVSHNKLTSAACDMLSTALTKPQNVRGWGMSGTSTLGSRKDIPGTPKRPAQTPAKGFNSCLQELNLSWNALGKRRQNSHILPFKAVLAKTSSVSAPNAPSFAKRVSSCLQHLKLSCNCTEGKQHPPHCLQAFCVCPRMHGQPRD